MISDAETDAPSTSMAGRAMALDLGEKRIGVAVSDPLRTIARSFAVFRRTSRLADFEKIREIIDEQRVTLLIVGLPTLPSGKIGAKAEWARDYAADLSGHIPIEVMLWDESFTTIDAENSLSSRGIRGKRRRQRVDAAAAAFILQSYLDARSWEKL